MHRIYLIYFEFIDVYKRLMTIQLLVDKLLNKVKMINKNPNMSNKY